MRHQWTILLMTILLVLPVVPSQAAGPPQITGRLRVEVETSTDRTDVFVVNSSTGRRQLVYTSATGTVPSHLATLSPDGQYVALVEYLFQPPCVTSAPATVEGSFSEFAPNLCPDQTPPQTKIVLVDVGSIRARDFVLPDGSGMPTNPLWSPDATRLAYVWSRPLDGTVELWVARVPTGERYRLATADWFETVLVLGKSPTLAWEETSQAIYSLNERDGQVYRVTLDGQRDRLVGPARDSALESLTAAGYIPSQREQFTGMLKPVNVRNYDDTCGDGYTGLYPDYGGCVLWGGHPAVDLSDGSTDIGCGTPVGAACTGVIIDAHVWAYYPGDGVCANNTGYPVEYPHYFGSYVLLRCDNIPVGYWNSVPYEGTIYIVHAHLSSIEPGLGAGVWVEKGQKLGEVGSTGNADGPHLHYQMEKDNQPNHPWYWTDYGEIDTYTWNPMYFVQAHENWDETAPTTQDSIAGTMGQNDWYISNVQVTLNAADNAGGSGLKWLKYWVDGTEYTEVDGSVSFTISGDGRHSLRYYAEDNSGNREVTQSALFPIDTAAPTGSLTLTHGSSTTYATLVRLDAAASDTTSGSGVWQARLRDSGGAWDGWQSLQSHPHWLLPVQNHQTLGVELQFRDYAGNESPVYADTIYLNLHPARPASANYCVSKSTLGISSSSRRCTTNYCLGSTAAQPSGVNAMDSANYGLRLGYWRMDGIPGGEWWRIYLPVVSRGG